MKIVVGSKNPVKVKACENVFKLLFENFEISCIEVKTKKQPLGMHETIKGAIKRAEEAVKYGDIGVGIEAGLIEIPFTESGYFDIQFCAIKDGKKLTLGCGMGFEYPRKVVDNVLKGSSVGEIIAELSGISNIGRKIGAIGFLSNGIINREKLTEQAVLAALIPRIRKELYL